MTERIKEKGRVHLEEVQILGYFSEEAGRDNRLSVVKGALGLA